MVAIDANNELRLLLEEIKKRPSMYIGSKSLSNLRIYIDGFLYGICTTSGKENLTSFLFGFQEWIANKFDVKTMQHWSSIIRFFSVDDIEAFDKFYELLNEYSQWQ